MAFGFGFNKQKVLSAAEKFVQQGKLQNAIAEYDKVLKNDADDLTVNNTIGDLYARLGDSAKAIECFKKVGDAYAAQGFTVKGIAMYKKITKITPSVDGSLKLAELYTQQGLFNDARAQYLQVAEDFMKNGDLEQAVRLFQKVLEMDPENVPMRVKLAEVYVRLGKKAEAWDIFTAAAESLRARGSLPAAEDILKRMLALDPGNSYVLLLRGKAALDADDPKSAIAYLEKAPDLDSKPEGLHDLLQAYLLTGNVTKAAPIAEKLLTVHNDPEGLFLLADGCARLGQYHEALDIYTRHADRLLGTDSAKLLSSLHTMITHVRDDSGALDALLLLLNKAGESTHVNEVTELLAHSSVKDGDLARARDLYQMLSTTEPQNQMHLQNYQQVMGQLNELSPASGITPEEGAVIIEELEATAPAVEQFYPDDVAIAVRSAVTDADLFLSYNLPDKAVLPLLNVLPQAPRDARLNQRLAALHTRYQRFTEAAVCCRTLESVYHDAGHPDEASRYGELAERYEQSAATITPILPPVPLVPAAKNAGPKTVPARSSAAAAQPVVAPPKSAAHAPKPDAAAPKSAPTPAASHAQDFHPDSSPAEVPEFAVQEFAVDELAVEAPAEDSDTAAAPASDFASAVASPVHAAEVAAAPSEISSDLSSEWEDSLSVEELPVDAAANAEAEHAEHVPEIIQAPAAFDADSQIHFHAAAGADLATSPEITETVEEVRFYLEHFMIDQARSGLEKLEALTSDARILDPLRTAIAAAALPPAEPDPEIPEINADADADVAPVEYGLEMAAPDDPEIAVSPDLLSGFGEETHLGAQPSGHEEIPAGLSAELPPALPYELPAELELQSAFDQPAHFDSSPVTETHAELVAPEPSYAEPVHAEPVHAQDAHAGVSGLSSFVADLEASLGDSFPQAAPPTPKLAKPKSPAEAPLASWPVAPSKPAIAASTVRGSGAATAAAPALSSPSTSTSPSSSVSYSPTAVRPLGAGAQAMHPSDSVDLSEMFGELKQELEEDVAAGDDDPETHYNLGVAFREMGLLDEAIAELQKVCAAIDRGKPFSQPVQTYTWLAQCFLDKGVPEAAIRWYEKALEIPGLDNEARLAINYELGSACEAAHDKPAALRHFTSVYGSNIDYRDVAERIQALKS